MGERSVRIYRGSSFRKSGRRKTIEDKREKKEKKGKKKIRKKGKKLLLLQLQLKNEMEMKK